MNADVHLDDESIPIWMRRNECIRMLDLALLEAKRRGAAMVEAEREYYSKKAHESFELLEAGYANTYIQTVIKGRPGVSEAMSAYHAAEVEYKNACEAINVFKMKLRSLESDMEREYEQTRRM